MIETQPITAAGVPIGVEVRGLTAKNVGDDAVRKQLLEYWIDRGLMLFRGVEGPEMQIAISNLVGECVSHPGKPMDEDKKHPELVNISYNREGGDVYEVDGVELGAWLPWHSDLIYVDAINHGGVLRPIKLPSTGGATGFIDKITLYETLDPALRDQLEDKWVLYKWDLDIANQRFGRHKNAKVIQWSENRREMQSRLDQYPLVAHPAVFVQPETGRKVLNVSPWFALGIEGMEGEEGDELLRAVVRHCTNERYAYYHSYKPDDMVLWDNWRMLHCGAGIPADDSRHMCRTTIAGDYNLGRLADKDTVIDDRLRISV